MKLKSKLVLAASSLLVLSAAAVGTGTYAWFTATQNAVIGVNQIDINTDARGLTMTAVATDTTHVVAGTGTANNPVFTATKVVTNHDNSTPSNTSDDYTTNDSGDCLTDVSSNGIYFYKASFTNSVISGSALKQRIAPYVYELTLTFKSDSQKPMAIFFSGKNSSITNTASPAPDSDLAGAVRVAIVNYTTQITDEKVLTYYCPKDTIGDTYTYLTGTGAETAKVSSLASGGTDIIDATKISTEDFNDSTTTKTSDLQGYLGTASTTDLVVRARIWIEGQDAECLNANLDQHFDTLLKFYGISNIKTA